MLDAAAHLGLDALLAQDGLEGAADLVDGARQLGPLALHRSAQLAVLLRLQLAESQVLQLQADGTHAQAIGQGGVELQGLPADAAALLLFHHPEGLHVVEAVAQLHQQDAHILAHGHQQLADILRVEQVPVREGQLAHLGEAVHDVGHFLPELGLHLGLGHQGVFHHVVEHAAGHAHGVQPPVRQALGHRQGVEEVGLAALSQLGGVHVPAHGKGPIQKAKIPIGVVLEESGFHAVESPLQGEAGLIAAG